MRTISYVAVIMLVTFSNPARAGNKDFRATFDECGEFVGIGFVPADRARTLVPSRYTLAGDSKSALLVVRVASCAVVSIDGKKSGAARTAQIGVMLDGPDGSADINNYLLWFVTDSGTLHGKLQAAGIRNGNDQQLKFAFEPIGGTGTLSIDVSAPRFPRFPLLGNATVPGGDSLSFVASWFADGKHGTLRMRTSFQELRFGDSDIVLEPPAESELAELIGSPTLKFTELHSYNEWKSATMQAALQ